MQVKTKILQLSSILKSKNAGSIFRILKKLRKAYQYKEFAIKLSNGKTIVMNINPDSIGLIIGKGISKFYWFNIDNKTLKTICQTNHI